MPPLILVQLSRTTQVTWSLQDTATHHTSPNLRCAARREDISSCPTTLPNNQTMGPSSQLHNYQGGHVLGGRGWGGGSTSTAEKPSPPAIPLNSWAIPNLWPQCRRTTPLHLGSSTTIFSRNLKQWIWNTIGSATENVKDSFNTTGPQANGATATT